MYCLLSSLLFFKMLASLQSRNLYVFQMGKLQFQQLTIECVKFSTLSSAFQLVSFVEIVSLIFCFSARLTKHIEVFPTVANNQHHHSAFHQNLERAVKSVGTDLFHQRNKSTTESCPSLSCCENIIIYFHSVSSLFDLSSLHPNGFIRSLGETHVMIDIRLMCHAWKMA